MASAVGGFKYALKGLKPTKKDWRRSQAANQARASAKALLKRLGL